MSAAAVQQNERSPGVKALGKEQTTQAVKATLHTFKEKEPQNRWVKISNNNPNQCISRCSR
jgi:hypothetical protein